MARYYVYIMTNATRALYIGVTTALQRHFYEHKCRLVGGLSNRYSINWLAYYGANDDVAAALSREKQLKR